jgi:hypothetical protein
MRFIWCVFVFGLLAVPALAAPVLDGTRDAGYDVRSVQTVETQFGDANPNGGSELDAGWARVEGGTLYLVLTGNLENNFNKLNVFIDSVAGGENVITNNTGNGGNNPSNDGWAAKYAGFTFDTGFAADYLLILRNGNFGGDRFDVDFNSVGNTSVVESTSDIFGGSLTGSNASVGASALGVAFDRSNTLGVLGGTNAANQAAAAAVTTGIELAIPLAAIGNADPQDIKISAMINGSNHDYLSNQFLGGLAPPQGNLGGDGAGGFNGTVGQINLNASYAGGLQCFSVVPEPSTLVMFGLALAGLFCGRRHS